MKAQVPRLACTSIASLFLLAGLVYSALALAPTPVYAAACDCNEELQDATIICNAFHGYVVASQCPYNTDHYYFQCSTGQQYAPLCSSQLRNGPDAATVLANSPADYRFG